MRPASHWAAQWRPGGAVRAFAVPRRGHQGLVGGCELRIQSMALRTSRTGPAASTEGTATHAGRWLCHATMRSRLAQVAEDNNASRRVAERAGFTKQETFTGEDGQPMVRYIHAAPRI
jgi:RimJ/RimL family protein N-acetyltransferase